MNVRPTASFPTRQASRKPDNFQLEEDIRKLSFTAGYVIKFMDYQ